MITSAAVGVLLASLAVVWMLSRAKLIGTMAVIGFVLGTLATVSMVVLVQGPA
jgi:hypothetical protein